MAGSAPTAAILGKIADEPAHVPWASSKHRQRLAGNHSVVVELSLRFDKQQRRWNQYSKLLGFFAFVLLFLAVLWMQRDAQTGHAVYSTIRDNVVGSFEQDVVTAAAEVLPWLRHVADKHWKDPACGDGKCQAPFEFPSYSRFGCRADCSQLDAVASGTFPLQVDLYFDFQHATGSSVVSLPPTALMELAAWNVCPEDAPHGRDCLFEQDQIFETIKGSMSRVVGQVPPGRYELLVKRDYFNKVRGAVRNVNELERFSRQVVKVDVALSAAAAGWQFETAKLQAAKEIAQTTLPDRLISHLGRVHDDLLLALDVQKGNLAAFPTMNAFDAAVSELNTTMAALLDNIRVRRHHVDCQVHLEPFNLDARAQIPEDILWDAGRSAGTSDLVAVKWKQSAATDAAELSCVGVADVNACECGRIAAYASVVEPARYDAVVSSIVTRLDPERSLALKSNYTARLEEMLAHSPEQVPYLTTLSRGVDQQARARLQLESHVRFYFEGPNAVGAGGQANEADENLKFATVSAHDKASPLQRLDARNKLVQGINARLDEVQAIRSGVFKLPEVEALLQAQDKLTDHTVPYNLVAWHGGKDAYQVCNIEERSPRYSGTCTPGLGFELNDVDDKHPYSCLDSAVLESPELCTQQVDMQLDCDAMCVCANHSHDGTTARQGCPTSVLSGVATFCQCEACMNVVPAAQEPGFQLVQDIAMQASSPEGSNRRLRLAPPAESGRRELQQTSTDVNLQGLKSSVDTLATSQTSLSQSVKALTDSVDQASQDASDRSANLALQTLIASGQAQLRADQEETVELMNVIIGKQNEALELAAASQASLDAITTLTNGALESLQNIELRFESTIKAIKAAASSSLVSAGEALDLWKRARRQRLANARNARLINLPCSYTAVSEIGMLGTTASTALRISHAFRVAGQLSSALTQRDAIRDRWVGTSNRIVGGMLVHTTRKQEQECARTRFPDIQNICMGDILVEPLGVDPTFKAATESFNPDLSTADMLRIYNCTAAFDSDAVYDVEHSTIPDLFTNQAPFCEQYYNTQHVPWGFRSHVVAGHPAGYPIWLDVNLSHAEILRWLQYLEDGLFFDTAVETVSIELITYNAHLRIFSKSTLLLLSDEGGAYHVTRNVDTIRVELYQGLKGAIQLVLEVALCLSVAVLLMLQMQLMTQAHIHEGSFLAYYTGAFDILDLLSTLLMAATLSIWWIFAYKALHFKMSRRFEVYNDARADAFLTRLHGDSSSELERAAAQIESLDDLTMLQSWYHALNGINILAMIARALHLMHFHPRLGIVTRSLVVALPDLLNFLLVGGVVFTGYAMMAHLIFGSSVARFASLSGSMVTCLEIIMGDMSINDQLRALPGLLNSVGQLFFWSFELIVFMVLLNFLLAIIVDSFCEVKEATVDTTHVINDVGDLLRAKRADFLARLMRRGALDDGLGPRSRVSIVDMGAWLRKLAFANAPGKQRHDPSLLVGTDNRVLQLGGARLTKEDLKQVLHQQHVSSRGKSLPEGPNRRVHPLLKACFGVVEPVDLGDATQLDLMAYWIFERFSEEDSAAPRATAECTTKIVDVEEAGHASDSEEQEADMHLRLQQRTEGLLQLQQNLSLGVATHA